MLMYQLLNQNVLPKGMKNVDIRSVVRHIPKTLQYSGHCQKFFPTWKESKEWLTEQDIRKK